MLASPSVGRRSAVVPLIVWALAAGVRPAAGDEPAETWRAGVARVNITPQEAMWMSGYVARTGPARGTRHELWAKALVLEDAAGRRAVLVTMDLLGIDRTLSLEVRERLERRHGLPRAAIALASSHTHTGPVVGDNVAPMFAFDERQQAQVDRYAAALADHLVALVDAAIADLAPATLAHASSIATFAVNRRNNPEADVPRRREAGELVGPVDHDVPVLTVRGIDGALRAVVAGYACHATVLSDDLWSGDWPGAAQAEIERRLPGATALYWCGCGADQNPIPRRAPELVDQYGRELADAVVAAVEQGGESISPQLSVAYQEIDLPFGELPTRGELLALAGGTETPARRAQRLLQHWDRHGALPNTYPYPVQLWRLGNRVSWYLLGGEVVVDYALAIKSRHPDEPVWVAAYANDVMGYIVSRRVLAEGGYEGRDSAQYYGLPALWSPEIERDILDAVARLREAASIAAVDLRCERLADPLAVAPPQPRLSWRLQETGAGPAHGLRQTAWQIRAATTPELLERGAADLWDSGRVASSDSQHVRYEGRPLLGAQACYWQVRVWDQDDAVAPWSPTALWRAALASDDWHGPWISADGDADVATANQYYRRRVTLDAGATGGVAYVASLGYHELFVNGRRVGDGRLAPAISDPMQRVRYVAYDLSPYLRPGDNVVAIAVGAGWTLYDGQDWPPETVQRWPSRPALRVELRLHSADGSAVARLASDDQWRTHPAAIQPIARWVVRNFNGERRDDALRQPGWTTIEFDDAHWTPAVVREEVSVRLTPQQSPPNRILEVIPAARIERRDDGAIRVELAKMFNGHLDLRLQGRPGAEVVVDVSDRPEVDQVYNQQHRFVVGPAGHARFRNRFNYTTGQWLTIRGEVEVPRPEDVRGLLIATDLGPPARFECDLPHVEQLYETALHTLRCLSLGGYVVDCSHRERLGYGGDGQGALQLLLPTLDGRALLAKWLEDWVDVQQPDGNLPFTAPTYGGGGGPMWSGFIVHGAAEMHERHGDLAPAAHAYPAIARWLEFLQTHVRDGLLQRHAGPADFISARWSFLGDWVAPGRQQGPNGDDPETHFLNNAYYVWTLNRAGNLAAALGHDDDAERWRQQARDVARATHDAYWRPEEQTYSDGRQPSLALALVAQLPPPALRDVVVKRLVEQITDACGGHLDTGISGTQFLLRALQQIERADLGLLMIGQRDQPGWRYMLDQNATALWEQWDGGHSRCHASFLGVGGWMIESLVGVQGGRPTASDEGDSCWTIVPSFAEGADFAAATVPSPVGEVACHWRRTAAGGEVEIVIPPNAWAVVVLPTAEGDGVRINGRPLDEALHAPSTEIHWRGLAVRVGSGRHVITCPL